MHRIIRSILSIAGIGQDRATHLEKWLSAAGGLAGLTGVMLISQAHLGTSGSVGLVASMGASAVLLFAVPHGPLSQPWPVFGGHLVSAIVGVACAKLIAQPMLAAPVAVGLAIGSMHYLRCIHPPGGATALVAVIGGEPVHQLGFHFVLTPVLWNAIVILAVALLFNYPFTWRRYPLALTKRSAPAVASIASNESISESKDERRT
jgi:CBS domain-containing membrane protein